ncbi:bifunctional serine/threonine-protein kinase/ABC transporter substrate-binding protein [Streptomyces sp. enrichment culture]|uniref:bifunctional serine/threonine-protein kinase/ABC transporter substrate-binding protein n=1 Tax=Streptomyces sp. enrichment culture TaxID=1795815 RepID=UPI003F54D268
MTDRLLPSDPVRLGGHRLLARLGAGGMGVVYLARTDAGDLAAVKVIQPEYAEDAAFRERFRREVAAARRVVSPWVVRVTGADAEARAPWLATAFVPGPSLAEAVARCGPLPEPAVRVLGRVLARALGAVHEAGLVHRDVKPGNVLLALDGPRLIDFGIARSTAPEATALTSDSVVVGTPGFLSPEQARARDDMGPASDVFSLGCVLAYAATGRPPFGTGAVEALLYRTVHDRPDLGGIEDTGLRDLLERCLAKEPGERPGAARLAELLGDPGASGAGEADGSVDWLPEDVVRVVADRTAEILALPAVEPTQGGAPTGPARRRLIALAAGGAALAAAGGGAALWAVLRDDGAGDRPMAAGRRWVIGVQADLSGPQREAGRAQERAVRMAVEEFNSRTRRPFTLAVQAVDDQGLASGARAAAQRLTGDRDVLAVVGPTGFTAAAAALPAYESAGLPLLTVSELSLSAPSSGLVLAPKVYFYGAPPAPSAGYMTDARLAELGVRRPGVVMDRAGRLTGRESVQMATNVAEKFALDPYVRVVPAAAPDPAVVISDMIAHGIDALFYTGTPERAARFARALAARTFSGPTFLDMPAAADAFIATAGPAAAEGWEAFVSYTSPDAPAVRGFAAAHRKRYGEPPGVWAVEAYDITRLVADRVTALHRRHRRRPTRAEMTAAIRTANFEGVAGTYAFERNGLFKGSRMSHLRVVDGRWRPVTLPPA